MSEEQSLRLPSTEVTRLDADDTIEIPLTAEDTLALAQAPRNDRPWQSSMSRRP